MFHPIKLRNIMMGLLSVTVLAGGLSSAAAATTLPDPAVDNPRVAHETAPETARIVLAGGCFWGVQAVFQHVKGVVTAISGYAGGKADTAHYDMVSTGTTGHAEAVQVTYDPSQITLGQILKIYFAVAHDPTELNYQGPDHGTQYRSTIFYADDQQKKIAAAYIDQLNQAKVFARPIVTTLEPLSVFYKAEEHHQDYARLNPYSPYILINDHPKIVNLQQTMPGLFRDD